MSELRGERLQKLVLAQRYAEATVHDVWAFESEPNSFSFCFQPDDDIAFQGTSPELLFRQAGREVVCDALAGTRARGDDDAMKAALLNDQKDGEEHRLVVDYLHDQLSKLGEVHVGERTIRTTATLHHLFTPVAATVGAHASVLSQIHPTPALAGFPTQDAVQWLSRNEPFDRGWYGGTIGVINGDDACFAVAIRSALLTRDATFLYAGAGVVPMSDCDAEWREIENKRRAIAERFLRST